jgi:hypothetical protein
MIKAIKNFFRKKKESSFTISDSSGLNDTFLFDFKNYQSGYRGSNSNIVVSGTFLTSDSSDDGNTTPQKIAIKPIDVLEQLERVPTPWTLTNLDEKISILKYKEKLITQSYSRNEVTGLIERLQNRKKYMKHKAFFDSFDNTTDEKIEVLLEKYDLVMKTSDLFIPEFPDDAIEVMRQYTKVMKKICKKKPVFYVIAEPDKFRKAYEKRDPILLVQSPFGFYWQILGAWDKEMLLLSEL